MERAAALYREHALHPALARSVEAAWSVSLDPGAAPVEHLVIPDGCIDIVVAPDRPPFVAGPATRPLLSRMEPGTAVHGLRFRPGAAPAVLGVAAHELRDDDVALSALWGGGPHGEPLDPVALQRLVAGRNGAPDPQVDAAVAHLRRSPGTDVRALADAVALSDRQLRRRFHDAVGYGPKRLARVLRLQALLAAARRRPQAGGSELAFAAGYADQPHMAREVRALAGVSASTLIAERGRSVQDGDAAIREAA